MVFGQPPTPAMDPEAAQQAAQLRLLNAASESCAFKFALSGVGGFGLGAIFGMFMASMSVENTDNPIYSKPLKEQMKIGLGDMAKRSYSSAKNFAVVGALFAGTECCIESYRAKNDIWNSVSGGCVTGAILARNAGPQAMAFGCGGFAAFSAASK